LARTYVAKIFLGLRARALSPGAADNPTSAHARLGPSIDVISRVPNHQIVDCSRLTLAPSLALNHVTGHPQHVSRVWFDVWMPGAYNIERWFENRTVVYIPRAPGAGPAAATGSGTRFFAPPRGSSGNAGSPTPGCATSPRPRTSLPRTSITTSTARTISFST